jgi:hypothetical protein
MRIFLGALALIAGTAQAQEAAPPRILVAGDSTVQTYDVVHYPRRAGGSFWPAG